MLVVETIAKIRRAYFAQHKPIKTICREFRVSRKVVRKVIRSQATEFRYERGRQPLPRIDPWRDQLDGLLLENAGKPTRERLTLIRIFEELRALGYEGSYDAVRRYAKRWRAERGAAMAEAYVPLSSAPGEAYQFDWSHEVVLINGTTVTVKVAHVRLCHSRMLFVRAYPRETQEMVFDAHNRAFAFFKGTCTRGIYDNMKTAVETVFIGKEAEWGGLECASRRPGLSRRGPKHKVSCGPSAIGERRDPVPSRLILSCPVPIWVPKTPRSGCRSSQARTVE
jgi:transposase